MCVREVQGYINITRRHMKLDAVNAIAVVVGQHAEQCQ